MKAPLEMEARTEPSSAAGVLALAPQPRAKIATRRHAPQTRLAETHGLLSVEPGPVPEGGRASLVTRRHAARRRRRRKRVLTVVAVVLGLFPPMWALYLIGWLIWRSQPTQQSMRRVRRALRALEKDQTGVALRHLQEAHYLDPANSDALYWLGLLLSQQQRPEEAAEALSLVAARVPGLPEVEAALVDAYVAMAAPEAAVYHAQRLLDVAPYAPETPLRLADAFEAAGRLDLAIEALEQAPLHKPVLTDALVQIHYRLGALYEREGRPEKALHHLKRVYARDAGYRDVRARLEALAPPEAALPEAALPGRSEA